MKWDDIGADKPRLEPQTRDYEVRITEEVTTHTADTAALIQLEIPPERQSSQL